MELEYHNYLTRQLLIAELMKNLHPLTKRTVSALVGVAINVGTTKEFESFIYVYTK